MTDIDVGQISEALNDKMDRDMNNRTATIHYVIETYVDGTSGYRVWDDGYCEQWGEMTSNSTITFLKVFTNTNYIIILGQSGSGASATVGRDTWNSKTVNGFSPIYNTVCDWKACGYLASD